jgi:ThiF family
MSWGTNLQIHRTAKVLLERGFVSTPEQAVEYLHTLTLQVAVGPDFESAPAAVAALATVVNAGHRVFLGGVRVRLASDPVLDLGWTRGKRASEVVAEFGGIVTRKLDSQLPTIAIIDSDASGSPTIHLGWNGWAGGVSTNVPLLGRSDMPLAGVLAGALAVSELFQRALGAPMPGRRSVGISLWDPTLDWASPDAAGPELEFLPAAIWLLGLGHLGQAFAWSIGLLPYADTSAALVGLMDFDRIERGNLATQLLTVERNLGRPKARVAAERMESLGFRTKVVERAFDDRFELVAHASPNRNEPRLALAGFDDPAPRRYLDVFDYVVDAGLGSGPVEYLDALIRSFPGPRLAADVFAVPIAPAKSELHPAYEAEIARQVVQGTDEAAARCGLIDLAGISAGASFVGAAVSCLAIGDILRYLHGGARISIVGLDLRNPGAIQTGLRIEDAPHISVPWTSVDGAVAASR